MVEMHLVTIRVEMSSNTPVLVLREAGGLRRTLPILIGQPEATAIAFALQGIETPRPMTHDLFGDTLAAMGATLQRVVVSELVQHTYFAELHIEHGGRTFTVSCRPSDAIALAVRSGSPIFADDDLMDAEGLLTQDEVTAPPDDEVVDQFRRFIDDVRPEDFAS